MQTKRAPFLNRVIPFGKLLLLPLALLTITRILFYLFNVSQFNRVYFTDFLYGVYFDAVTIGLFFLPFAILFLLPFAIHHTKIVYRIEKILFIFTSLLLVAFNLMDIEYFSYTFKRSTFDLFFIVSAGSDMKQLLTTFIADSWHFLLILIISGVILNYFYSKFYALNREQKTYSKKDYILRISQFVIGIGIFILLGRGGFPLKPISIIDASKYTTPSNTALVLNTPFTIVKSYGQKSLQEKKFFASIEETEKYFSPIQSSNPANILPDSTNVVVIMLESFGPEFIGFYNPKSEGYTPFLDSILEESWSFEYGFANGKKSIEAVSSIFTSIPTLMDNPYISSPYSSNKVMGLPKLLKEYGYSSAFYHGATNGSMRFDAFSRLAGFDHYFGRFEYGNDDHFDETWGILDEYFNPWAAEKMSELQEPFIASLFTLSSHHPYYIPLNRRKQIKKGPQKMCASINYGDFALRRFFEVAQQQDWYENTLFVICADHTPATKTKFYNLRTQIYRIPLAFYHPSGKLGAKKSREITQQLDIYPSILDLLNIDVKFYSYGSSVLNKSNNQALSYLEGNYYFFKNQKMLTYSSNKARNLYDFTSQEKSMAKLDMQDTIQDYELILKAIIQRYNHDLIRNQTTAE